MVRPELGHTPNIDNSQSINLYGAVHLSVPTRQSVSATSITTRG